VTIIKKLPLWAAVLININIVVGGGFFISASNIFQVSGALAPLTWIFCGLLLLPLVVVLSHLSRLYPQAGGLYVYSKKNLGDFWGFISGWSYFVGTLAGNALILHFFSKLTKQMGFSIPFAHYLPPHIAQFSFDTTFIILFTILNLLNITILEKIHVGFTILKMIPFGLVIVGMFFLFDIKNVIAAPIKPSGIFESMPIVLFAYLGIEACCAITHKIQDGKRNAARAMLISLGIIIATYALVQFGLLGILGAQTNNPFFEIVPKLTNNATIISWGNLTIKFAILSSYIGGFYGMYYANSWNLYAIAKEKKILFSKTLTKLNKYHTPWTCIILQGTLVLLLLLVALKSPLTLIPMSTFGVVIAYLLSVLTYFIVAPNGITRITMGSLALVGSSVLLLLCLNDLIHDGVRYLIPFTAILLSGLILYFSSPSSKTST